MTSGEPNLVSGEPPKGLLRVVVINSVFALISLVGFTLQAGAGNLSALTAFGAFVWICLGPALLFRKPLTWRIGRTLIYAYAMGLALLIVFAILQGALLRTPIVIALEVLLVVYLIGVRGYLNSESARDYYSIRPPGV